MTVRSYLRSCAAVSRGETKCGSFWLRSRNSLIHRNRDSSGLNWNPHFIFRGGFSSVAFSAGPGGGDSYAISVGTLSLRSYISKLHNDPYDEQEDEHTWSIRLKTAMS